MNPIYTTPEAKKEALKANQLRFREKHRNDRYFRKCPKCDKLLAYKTKRKRDVSDKENRWCIPCTTTRRHKEGKFPYTGGGGNFEKMSRTCQERYGVPYPCMLTKLPESKDFVLSRQTWVLLNECLGIQAEYSERLNHVLSH